MRTFLSCAAVLSALLSPTAGEMQEKDDPLLRPIEPETAARWLTPQAPVRVFGNSYFVGFGGLGIMLVDTGEGLILFDGGVPQAVSRLEANIRTLGFDIADVKLIFSTEVHWDHSGGIAALVRDSGATAVASEWGARWLEKGETGPEDPQHGFDMHMPPVKAVRAVADGEKVRLGNVTVTAVATPGHTPGSMSWRWQSCDDGICRSLVFGASLNAVSTDGYRFSDPAHREVVHSLRTGIAKMRVQPCDILIITHPDQFGMDKKLSQLAEGAPANPLYDPGACAAYADAAERRLESRLSRETGGD